VTIAVAAGSSKVEPLLGALRTGVIKILVTDVATAEAVVEADQRGPVAG
jgi:DNA-binding transcriptional regulator LsrR (DeoR family)